MIKKIFILFICYMLLFFSSGISFLLAEENVMKELVSLDYKDAELVSVLRSIAASYDLNIVPAKEIKGKINVSLKDIPLEEALEAILLSGGYTYTQKGKIIYITSFPDAENMNFVSNFFHLKYLSAPEAKSLLEKTISSKGDIRTNDSTNSIVVTDHPLQMQKIKELLEKVDIPPIQVLIESKIVDITSSDLETLGVNYNAEFTSEGLMKSSSNTSYTHLDEIDGTIDMDGASSSLSGGQFVLNAFSLKNLNVSATIDALVQDQKANLLASPSIATLNGKEARIIIGEKYPYKEKTQTTTGTTETTKFVDVGTTLRVTPQVSQDGWITLVVHPEVSSVSESLDAGPRITTREADATVRVKDGHTIVIGGLLKTQDDHVINRIPVLGYIPILGIFFSSKSKDVTQKELAVFITPHIIKSDEEKRIAGIEGEEEVYVNIEGTGQRVIINTLLKKANNLELNEGIESIRKDKETRMAEAIDLYNHIAVQFPNSEKADDALLKAGMLYLQYFKDYEMARKSFFNIIELYPKSPYVHKANQFITHIDKKTAKKNRK